MANPAKTSQDKLEAALEKVRQRFRHRSNYTGSDIGYRWTAGKRSNELVIRIHVETKIPKDDLSNDEAFPGQIDGIPLDVIGGNYETNAAAAVYGSPQDRFILPYLVGGISCSGISGRTGTAGLLVVDRKTGAPGLVSNAHVLAGSAGAAGDAVLHPGRADGGTVAAHMIGRLARWMLDRDGDAAVAILSPQQRWLPLQLGSLEAVSGARRVKLGEVLSKFGRSSRMTEALVDGIGRYRVRYHSSGGLPEIREIDGFKLVSMTDAGEALGEVSAPGDSGAAWMSKGEVVGLHFAGESSNSADGEHALACHIDRVLDRLDLDVATFADIFEPRGSSAAASAEYTPRPGGPDWPHGPRWPGVPGWPPKWPSGPWPYPPVWPPYPPFPTGPLPAMPDPIWPKTLWPDNLVDLDGQMRPAPTMDRIVVSRAENTGMSATIDELLIIWVRLKAALKARNLLAADAHVRSSVSTVVDGAGKPLSEIARAIRESAWFKNAGLGGVTGKHLEGCMTFENVCFVLHGLIYGGE